MPTAETTTTTARKRGRPAKSTQATAQTTDLPPVQHHHPAPYIPAVFTVETLAQYLFLTERTIRKELSTRRLTGHKIASKWYILGADVLTWVASGSTSPKVPNR